MENNNELLKQYANKKAMEYINGPEFNKALQQGLTEFMVPDNFQRLKQTSERMVELEDIAARVCRSNLVICHECDAYMVKDSICSSCMPCLFGSQLKSMK